MKYALIFVIFFFSSFVNAAVHPPDIYSGGHAASMTRSGEAISPLTF